MERLNALSFVAVGGMSLTGRALGQLGRFTITGKHLLEAGGNWAKFATADTSAVRGLISQTLKSPSKIVYDATRNNYRIYSGNLGKIGTAGEAYVRVVVNSSGRIISAHPVKGIP